MPAEVQVQSSSLEQLESLLLLSSEQVPAPATGLLLGLSVGCFEGLAVIGLGIVGLAVFGLGVVGPVVGEGQGFKSLCESPWQTLRPHESC